MFPDVLLGCAHIDDSLVLRLSTLYDAPRREVAVCASRVAYGHAVIAWLVAFEADGSIARSTQRYIVRTVFGRIAVLVGVDAKHREVAGLARPHPVVGVATKLAESLRSRKDESHVAIHLVVRHVVGIAAVKGSNAAVHVAVGLGKLLFESDADTVRVVRFNFGKAELASVLFADLGELAHDTLRTVFGTL